MSVWSNVKTRLFGIAVAEDEALNAALGPEAGVPASGNAHFTVSQRLAEMRERGSKIGCTGCKILTIIQNKIFGIPGDHCTNSMSGDFPEDLPTGG